MERIIVVQLIKHFEKHQLNNPLQSAYRKHHSTETALTGMLNAILQYLDN